MERLKNLREFRRELSDVYGIPKTEDKTFWDKQWGMYVNGIRDDRLHDTTLVIMSEMMTHFTEPQRDLISFWVQDMKTTTNECDHAQFIAEIEADVALMFDSECVITLEKELA